MLITQNLPAAAAAPPPTPSSSDSSGVSDLFLQLLATQLKTQSPDDTVDPTAFVGQLIQFNSLDQLTQIKQLLAAQAASQTASGATASSTAASAAAAYSAAQSPQSSSKISNLLASLI